MALPDKKLHLGSDEHRNKTMTYCEECDEYIRDNPSRDCLNFLHAAWKHAGLFFFYKTWNIPGSCMETFCRITMQLPLFQLNLKTFPLLHHRDHFVFTRKFLK